GTTFGGNPLVCAAALASLDVIEDENLVHEAREKGEWFKKKVHDLNEPSIKEIRGKGLMLGIEFDFETKPLVMEMLHNGVIANATADNVLRIVPPLNISHEDLEEVIRVMHLAIQNIKENVEA
ncbi:MAG: aminotransferase class III-fold pyridoxal phosphate-dependent enzyme, partial [Cryomorphaceae bacterium]